MATDDVFPINYRDSFPIVSLEKNNPLLLCVIIVRE